MHESCMHRQRGKSMPTISAVLIVHNEEKNLPECLKRVQAVADEIVVMDSLSTDGTLAVARRFTKAVFQQTFAGFGKQKQDAIAHATHEWILQIDADEHLSDELIRELCEWKRSDPGRYDGFSILFRFYFLGRLMRFGGCGGERHIRLFKKASAHYGDKPIHEGVCITGPVGRLRHVIIHHSYDSLDEYFRKFNLYTSLIAQQKFAAGKRFHLWQILRLPYEFITRYIIKLGMLDGMPGLVYAMISSWYAVMKHIKLWELERRRSMKE
ncbi:MAG: glycosyltransferase [Elusimicrobia bacterium]|nr:glycosyltransferase [Elusimicrobiota bacterium]